MKITIDLTEDQIDEITMHSLRDAYRFNCKPDKIDNSDDDIPVDNDFLDVVDLVLRYYQNAEQQQEWEMEKWDI